jgi:hypothetical protein
MRLRGTPSEGAVSSLGGRWLGSACPDVGLGICSRGGPGGGPSASSTSALTTTLSRPWLLITTWALAGAVAAKHNPKIDGRAIGTRRRGGNPDIGGITIGASSRFALL